MKSIQIIAVSTALVLATGVTRGWAGQEPVPVRDGPVSFTALGGASFGSGEVGAAAGLSFGLDVNERVSVEARTVYFDRGPGQSAMDLNASVLVDLLTGRRAVPYVSIGGGLYRAMFDFDHPRLSGMMFGATQVGTGSAGQMPMFYARRFGDGPASGGRRHMQGFTDPSVSVGAGVRLDLTSRLYVRPDVRAITIFGGGDTYSVGSLTLSVGYRF